MIDKVCALFIQSHFSEADLDFLCNAALDEGVDNLDGTIKCLLIVLCRGDVAVEPGAALGCGVEPGEIVTLPHDADVPVIDV